MGSEKQRIRILNKIRKSFIDAAAQDKGIEENALIAEICIENGVTQKKAEEYIELLINAHWIERDEYGLWLGKRHQYTLNEEEKELLSQSNSDNNLTTDECG